MVRNVAPVMRTLEREDFYLLSGIEHGMRFGEWVDRGKLMSFADLDPEEVDYRLDRCLERELIERQTIQYEGYRLLFEGYDVLALRAFSEGGTIDAVGAPIGEGKESDVIEVRNDHPYALKFHREGLTNFRRVDRERDYTSDRDHVSWLYTARKAAEREYELLEAMHPHARVPAPIDHNRHGIIMERVDGIELTQATVADDVAGPLLRTILEELATVYATGYVHTDVSEYNVLVSADNIWLIDWPQAVDVDHPNHRELLTRDVRNIVRYFDRKHPHLFGEEPDVSEIVDRVTSDSLDSWQTLDDK